MMHGETVYFEDKHMFLESVGPFWMGAEVSMNVTVECDYYPGAPMVMPNARDDAGYPGDPAEIDITGVDTDSVTCYYNEGEYAVKVKTMPTKAIDEVFDYYQVNAEEVSDKIDE